MEQGWWYVMGRSGPAGCDCSLEPAIRDPSDYSQRFNVERRSDRVWWCEVSGRTSDCQRVGVSV